MSRPTEVLCKACQKCFWVDYVWNGLAWVRHFLRWKEGQGFLEINSCPHCGQAICSEDDYTNIPF